MKTILSFLVLTTVAFTQNPFQEEELNVRPADKQGTHFQFYGGLSILTDTGTDSLPVFLNGQKIGVTPFRATRLPVGQYTVSFLSNSLRDSLASGQIRSLAQLPMEVQAIFRGQIVTDEIVCGTLSEFSTQSVVIQQEDNSEVIFSVEDIRQSLSTSKKSFYAKVGLVTGLIVTMGLVIILSVN
ncbi:MAG: hypothetical protein V1913_04200 [Fibrobacterota bacterium]